MKTLFTMFFLALSANMILSAQTSNATASTTTTTTKKTPTYTGDSNMTIVKLSPAFTVASTEIDTSKNKYSFQYLTGSSKVDGYAMQIHSYSTSNTTEVTTFKNGKTAPILQVYVNNKSQYIGGVLENNLGKKTTITDITLQEKDSTLIFTVTGKDFSMSFTLNNGAILKEENDVSVFYTEKVGAWKIFKKK